MIPPTQSTTQWPKIEGDLADPMEPPFPPVKLPKPTMTEKPKDYPPLRLLP